MRALQRFGMLLAPSETDEGGVVSATQFARKRGNGGSPQIHAPSRSDLDLIDGADSALGVLRGRWKVHLLVFMARGIHRHSRLLRCLPGVSKKVMTDALRALERDGLVGRRVFAEVPVRVEYSLTPLGWTIAEPLMALSEWGEAHAFAVDEARTRYEEASTGK
jgi:DNA-binding HxlR family transcriptional regulator